MERANKIVAIIGPKGGVGKTTISANLAIALSRLGKKVVAVDLDLGASNLHAIFGIRQSKSSLDDFVRNRVGNLSDIVLDTDIENVGMVCGGDVPGIANMPYQQKMKLIRHLSKLDCDLVILDLAPGASYNVADFSFIAQKVLLVTTPEIPSLMNAYSFIKAAVFRRLLFFFKRKECPDLLDLLERAKDFANNPHLKTMEGFFREARAINPVVADSAKTIIEGLKPFLIVNRVRAKNDTKAGKVIQKMLREFLGIESAVIKTIREDSAVGAAIARMKPILIQAPDALFSQDIEEIALELRE